MTVDLEKLEGLAKAATRGPYSWTCYGTETNVCDLVGFAGDPDVYEYSTEVIEFTHHYGGWSSDCETNVEISDADKEYLAAVSPEVILELIALARVAIANGLNPERNGQK